MPAATAAPATPLGRADALFRALADPTRLRLLNLLVAGDLCVCDLVALLELPQSTVSRHLAALRRSGLIEVSARGRFSHYRLARAAGPLHAALVRVVRDADRTIASLARERRAAARAVAARAQEPCR